MFLFFPIQYAYSIEFIKMNEIELDEILEKGLSNPIDIKIDENSDIYILDFSESMLIKIDINGKLKEEIFKEGKGPGDLYLPSVLQIIENKICVFQGEDIDVFSKNLKFLKKIKVPFFVKTIVYFKRNTFVLDNTIPIEGKGIIKIITNNSDKEKIISKFPVVNVTKRKYEAFDYFYDIRLLAMGLFLVMQN